METSSFVNGGLSWTYTFELNRHKNAHAFDSVGVSVCTNVSASISVYVYDNVPVYVSVYG